MGFFKKIGKALRRVRDDLTGVTAQKKAAEHADRVAQEATLASARQAAFAETEGKGTGQQGVISLGLDDEVLDANKAPKKKKLF